ncbi:unnamed protein product [Parnassius apollo]|uniref:(apollo) hypothetical protein n=1 Tax=Parnassius apollo TaxID=110799 RepID=A0A8S3WZB9_PARAO|nr:unnamed protein product [Parnassius apollo]
MVTAATKRLGTSLVLLSVWRPGASPSAPRGSPSESSSAARSPSAPPPPPPPPVWTPTASPQAPRKTFRPVHFEDTPPARRKFTSVEQNGCTSGSENEGRLRTSQSAPATGLSALGGTSSSRLPRVQNPTVTLLQKARENQLTRAPSNIHERDPRLPRDRPSPPIGDPVHALRKGYLSEGEVDRSDYVHGGSHKMAEATRKIEGIGPTTKEGMPVALRSEVKDPSRWYKKMYDTIHKNKYDDDYVTIRYKNHQGQPPLRVSSSKSQYAYFDPRSGYLSEPEGGRNRLGSSTWSDAYDSDAATGPRRRTASVQEDRRDDTFSSFISNNKYSTLASARASQEIYKNQPGRIENYVPGKSSVVDKEAKQWWDEVMDIFDGQNISSTTSLPQTSPKEKKDITSTILSKSNMARALKESGYESDSTLVFRRREETDAPLSPAERRAAYRDLQAGGEPPLRGFRSPAPPRQDESEIEYIPISSTLTKIRVHKKTPHQHEVVCYPMNSESITTRNKRQLDRPDIMSDCPPAPPRRISSKNSNTLKLVTSTRHLSISPNRQLAQRNNQEESNINILKNKLSHKINRQNTQIISKKRSADTKTDTSNLSERRAISTSAPPSVNRKNIHINPTNSTTKKCISERGTSSFSSPRRTLQPTEYASRNKCGDSQSSVLIENGAGRKTPITNILEKVTSLDKLWSSQKRNERLDLPKHTEKYPNKIPVNASLKPNPNKPSVFAGNKVLPKNVTHKSRDMVRTSEKIQKLKAINTLSNTNVSLNEINKSKLQLTTMSNISKSTSHISSVSKKPNSVKTAVVTNLKKKKNSESVIIKPRSVPCHEACNKKSKGTVTKKEGKTKFDKKNVKISVNQEAVDSRNQSGNVMSEPCNPVNLRDITYKRISSKELETTRDSVLSNSFFQHLFLGNPFVPIKSETEQNTKNSVLQKAKHFQSLPHVTQNSPNSLNTYLVHRKPVSLSRFKIWDKHFSPVRFTGPRSVSWPGKIDGEIHKCPSLSKWDGFGSVSSLSTVRSKSEPPTNKIYFSQTSRPLSPNVIFHRKDAPENKIKSTVEEVTQPSSKTLNLQSTSPKSIFIIPQHCKTLSPSRVNVARKSKSVCSKNVQKPIKVNKSEAGTCPTTIYFSPTSRPTSPKVMKSIACRNRSQSTSPVAFRSPSYRRIHNARILNKQVSEISLTKEYRTISAHEYEKKELNKKDSFRTNKYLNLYANDPEYCEYIQDIHNCKPKTERFRELNRYYTYLERVAELEKATSTCDLRHRRKDEEIVDFDRWKKIRAIERAEEELNNLYHKLKLAQSENNFPFYPKDVNDFRWNSGKERGLRVKEKSVENLKEEFEKKPDLELSGQLNQSKDNYKPFWRGTSVAETAFNINRKNLTNINKHHATVTPTITLLQDSSLSELQKKIGLGNGLWSSLSIEQVNALKHQLNAIYSREIETKTNKDSDKYCVEVKNTNCSKRPTLHVRCNSLVTPPTASKIGLELYKSDSIAAITCAVPSVKELKNNVNKIQMTLSEIEKKKISQSLSNEILNRINKKENVLTTSFKKDHNTDSKNVQFVSQDNDLLETKENQNLNMCDTGVKEKADEIKLHVYPTDKSESNYLSSTSETETGSSDLSNKTVIFKGPSKEVLRKVEYFESVNNVVNKPKTIYHARDNSHEKNTVHSNIAFDIKNNEPQLKQISQSQSCTNLKEMFGECEKNKFLSLPSKPDLHSRSSSLCSEVCISDRRTPDTLRYSSDEAMWRSRTPSPDAERYWRTYIKLARAGEVRRIARRFDSPSAAGAILRRHQSDPEIARNGLHNNWSSIERISSHRDKCRAILPVSRVPLRPKNRFMPHIDIISKLAVLCRRSSPRSRSAEEALECRRGEVERIRRRFEAMSLLGPIYSSAPDVRELHNIAPYLACSWIAHRYPKPSDNNRSIKDPSVFVKGRKSPIKKEAKQSVSKGTNLSLKLKNDSVEQQIFDPSVHRPASRYEPPRTPPRPPPAAWPYRLAPFVTPSRLTVTFQGY